MNASLLPGGSRFISFCPTSSHIFTISGKPIPLARHRHGNGKTYNPQINAKRRVEWELKAQCPQILFGLEPLYLSCIFFMPIPNFLSTKKRNSLHHQPHIKTPDTSNLIKWVEDCANSIIFPDDKLIFQINAQKLYTLDEPHTLFEVGRIET